MELEERQIADAMERIAATRLGGPVIHRLGSQGWRIEAGWSAGATGFAFPSFLGRRIRIKPGLGGERTLLVLTHEIWHPYLYGGRLAASIEQEYVVESRAIRLRYELGIPSKETAWRRLRTWFDAPRESRFEEIRHFSLWHYLRLPLRQPSGPAALWYGLGQALFVREIRKPAPERDRGAGRG